jgi:hypothetical protein
MSTQNIHGVGLAGSSWPAEHYIDDTKARYVTFYLLYSGSTLKLPQACRLHGHGPVMLYLSPTAS